MIFQGSWEKFGLLYALEGRTRHQKLATHAANPVAVHLRGDIYRIYYSGRDVENRSSVGAVDIDILKREVVADYFEPFFTHGAPDSFFADGVSIGCHYKIGSDEYILFMGWQSPLGKHWRGDIGRLRIRDNSMLELCPMQPIFLCDHIDTVSVSYPWTLPRAGGGYDMWYGSTLNWDAGNGEMTHVINHAFSEDGEAWIKTGLAIPFMIGYAQAFSRPTVISNATEMHMWFSYRSGTGAKYRIGYAYYANSKWQLDLARSGIDVSETGWDSEMIEYPFVFEHMGRFYMLYNGNGHGRDGFGIAQMIP